MASGTVSVAHDPNGFGIAYPVLALDKAIGGHQAIYYGHTFPANGVIGKHVHAGQIIAYTGGRSSGGNASNLPNWLELGFWAPSYANGPAMRKLLHKLKAYNNKKKPKKTAFSALPVVKPIHHHRPVMNHYNKPKPKPKPHPIRGSYRPA